MYPSWFEFIRAPIPAFQQLSANFRTRTWPLKNRHFSVVDEIDHRFSVSVVDDVTISPVDDVTISPGTLEALLLHC